MAPFAAARSCPAATNGHCQRHVSWRLRYVSCVMWTRVLAVAITVLSLHTVNNFPSELNCGYVYEVRVRV